MNQEATFVTKWKDEMKKLIKLRFGKLDKDKVEAYLNKIISEKLKNPKAILENNYTNVSARTDVLSIFDLIEKNRLIIGGGGVLFMQHELRDNPLIAYILQTKAERNQLKNERKKYEKGTDEWFACDIGQGNKKIKINSLYGAHGYPGFVLYNRYIAEAVTNQGRQIITSAAEGFENFLMDNVDFTTESELFHYIYNILNEYNTKYKEDMDFSPFYIPDAKYAVVKRLINKCKFDITDDTVRHIEEIVKELNNNELTLLYYKNNFFEFNMHPIIFGKLKYIMENLEQLRAPEMYLIKDPTIKQLVEDLWELYNVFVLYNYPIFDRVRKAMYTDKKAVLYVDTDSNFIGLNKWVEYTKNDVLGKVFNKPESEIDFISVNLCTIFLGRVVHEVLQDLCRSMNTDPEIAKELQMKNEFYMETILFTDKKKRYISNAVLQEGQLLGGGNGVSEIKGFDFKKSTVKPFVTEFFTNICLEDILRSKKIDIGGIFKKMLELRKDIEDSMRRGENKYYKQMNVQIIEHYKNPYSTQGIRAVILWNTLSPDYHLELPIDIDVIPIRDLSNPKNLEWFEENYPAEYTRLKQQIIDNPTYYRKMKVQSKSGETYKSVLMNLNYIAKPKNYNQDLPEWLKIIIDTDKVVADTLSLFYPILQSLGLKTLTTTKNSEHLTNIVSL